MADSPTLEQLAERIADRSAGRIVAAASKALNGEVVPIEVIPGVVEARWVHRTVANPWHDHQVINGQVVTVQPGGVMRWPVGSDIGGGRPPTPGSHKGCQCRTVIHDVRCTFSASNAEREGDTWVTTFAVGVAPQSSEFRFRAAATVTPTQPVDVSQRGDTSSFARWATRQLTNEYAKLFG